MSAQPWQRRPPPGAASAVLPGANRAASRRPRGVDRISSAMAPTAASSGKKAACKPAQAEDADASQWRALRQSVHVRAAVDASARGRCTARIADLCETDRDKVAQLVRRVVEIGTIHEESEAAFVRERAEMRSEIEQLRAQAKRDASEIGEVRDELRGALLSLRRHQERVLALEESSDAETRARHEAEQTMDMLRAEVDKLRLLVRRQRDEMEMERRRDQERFQTELRDVSEQLRTAQTQLLQEREERVAERQRELDIRLKQQAESEKTASDDASTIDGVLQDERAQTKASFTDPGLVSARVMERIASSAAPNLSTLLDTSVELPEAIRAIMDDWKERMEEALSGAAGATSAYNHARKAPASGVGTHSRRTRRSASDEISTVGQLARSDGAMSCQTGTETGQGVECARMFSDKDVGASTGSGSNVGAPSSDEDAAKRVRDAKRLDDDPFSSSVDASLQPEAIGDRGSASDTDRSRKSRRPRRHKHGSIARIAKPSTRSPLRSRRRHKSVREKSGSPRSISISEDDSASDCERERRHRWSMRKIERHRSRVAMCSEVGDEENCHDSVDSDHLPHDSSFGSLYETSLFEVVDAIESVRARDEDARPRRLPSEDENSAHTPMVAPMPRENVDSGPHARLDRLKEHMEARERKFASRRGVHGHPRRHVAIESVAQGCDAHGNGDVDSVDDFEMFDAVKELYSRDLFAAALPINSALPSSNARLSDDADANAGAGGDGDSRWPVVSDPTAMQSSQATAHEIREAVENDIQALLRDEPLSATVFLSR